MGDVGGGGGWGVWVGGVRCGWACVVNDPHTRPAVTTSSVEKPYGYLALNRFGGGGGWGGGEGGGGGEGVG